MEYSSLFFFASSLFIFFFGAVVGSFLNVLIYRTAHEESWVTGRSKCENCKKKITWYDNIPLLSYVFLKGKCRGCQTPIAIIHPVVEALTGALFLWWYWMGSLFFHIAHSGMRDIQAIVWLIAGVLLLVIFIADVRYMIIPDSAVITLFVMMLLYRIVLVGTGVMQWPDFLLMLVSMIVLVGFFFFLWFITKGKGFGMGDVKFAAPMALILGYPKIVVGVSLAFLIGSIVGIAIMTLSEKKRGILIPFGPFLVVGTTLALFFGDGIWQWYLTLL